MIRNYELIFVKENGNSPEFYNPSDSDDPIDKTTTMTIPNPTNAPSTKRKKPTTPVTPPKKQKAKLKLGPYYQAFPHAKQLSDRSLRITNGTNSSP